MPQRFAFPTKHSLMRSAQRTNRSWDQIQHILDSGLFVDGGKPGFWQKRFLVFFHPDLHPSECFVAVQRNTGKVLTVMPQSYGKRTFPWITEAMYDKAKRLYERSVLTLEKERARAAIEADKKASELRAKKAPDGFARPTPSHVFIVKVNLQNEHGSPRIKNLLSIPSHAYDHSIPNLLSDKGLPDKLQAAFDNLKVERTWSVVGLTIRSYNEIVHLPLQ